MGNAFVYSPPVHPPAHAALPHVPAPAELSVEEEFDASELAVFESLEAAGALDLELFEPLEP